MTVTAINPNPLDLDNDPNPNYDRIWGSSNYSQVSKTPRLVNSPGAGIDVAAPDVTIYSTALGSSYTTLTGTSMAAAHVTGLIALHIAANGRGHTLEDVMKIRQAIVNHSQPQTNWASFGDTGDSDINPEPLAIPSENWIPQPNIFAVSATDHVAELGFNIVPGYTYTVQHCNTFPSTNQWTDFFATNGVGSLKTVSLSDSTSESIRFYRLKRSYSP
jgi:hypothetical protein